MKKRIFLILSFIVLALGSYAQNEREEELVQRSSSPSRSVSTQGRTGRSVEVTKQNYKFEFSIGPRVGIGLAMASEGDNLKVTDGSSFGWDAGLALNMRYGDKDAKGRPLHGQGLFGVGLELNYANRAIKTIGSENLKLNYFEVPLLFQIYPLYKTTQLRNLFVEIGPTFSMMLSSSPNELNINNNIFYSTGDFKGGDIKATIGLGWRFDRSAANDGLYLNLRYNLGTSNLAGNFPCKVSTAELTVGYLFKCIGSKRETSRKIR